MKKPKFKTWQMVRVIGADWAFLVAGSAFYLGYLVLRVYQPGYYDHQWWPEYLLESAE